jgi:hypothetical protein
MSAEEEIEAQLGAIFDELVELIGETRDEDDRIVGEGSRPPCLREE